MQFGNRPFGHRPFGQAVLQGSFGVGAGSLGKGTNPGDWVCHQGVGDRQFEAGGLNTGRLGKAVWAWQRGGGSDLGMVLTWGWYRLGNGSDLGRQFENGSVGMAAGRGPPLDVVHLGLAPLDVVHLGLAPLGVARLGLIPLGVAL